MENEDVILEMLLATEESSTKIDDSAPSNLTLKRDEKGILWSYDEETGEKVGRIYEHGNDVGNVAKTFNEIIEKERL